MTELAPAGFRPDPHLPYLADGPISAMMGLVLIFAAEQLTGLAGWSLPPAFFVTLGVILLPWALYNVVIGRMSRPYPAMVWSNIAIDLTWALGSVVLVAIYQPELTPIGSVLLLAQALAVGGMFVVKFLGARALLH